ncbi:MAG: hypothetical protein NTX50_12880 [Candidatus Sumerlaeota bacterium]|nr:hypothetical protein [Candidatus Sumerlaeota bacterium]
MHFADLSGQIIQRNKLRQNMVVIWQYAPREDLGFAFFKCLQQERFKAGHPLRGYPYIRFMLIASGGDEIAIEGFFLMRRAMKGIVAIHPLGKGFLTLRGSHRAPVVHGELLFEDVNGAN